MFYRDFRKSQDVQHEKLFEEKRNGSTFLATVPNISWLNRQTHACRLPTLRLPPRDDLLMVRGESGWLSSLSAGTFTQRHSIS
ncbi:MAG: hypothetical protein OXH79_02050 [Boseongicola sp.]|nr:hypothetical protein [Boseongicola sp.]